MRAAIAPLEPELVVFVGSDASEVLVEDGRLVEVGALELEEEESFVALVVAAGEVSEGSSVLTVV